MNMVQVIINGFALCVLQSASAFINVICITFE